MRFFEDNFWACYDKCEAKHTELIEQDLVTADLKKEQSLLDEEMSQYTQRHNSAVSTVLTNGSQAPVDQVSSETFGRWGVKLLDLSRRQRDCVQTASKIRKSLCEEEDKLNEVVVRALASVGHLPFEADKEKSGQSQASEGQQGDTVDKAARRGRLNRAADQVHLCETNFKAARSDTLSVPDSWNSDRRDQARVQKMVRRNNELREAEAEYHTALREVERDGPMGDASRESNPSDLSVQKKAVVVSIEELSLGESALETIEQWKSMIPKGATAEFAEELAEDKDMDRNKLTTSYQADLQAERLRSTTLAKDEGT